MGPHEEFLELCAVSTSGELTEHERKKLQGHFAGCVECREALGQFETVVDRSIPALSSELSQESRECRTSDSERAVHRGHIFKIRLVRYEFWLPYAAGILLCLALGVFVYRGGLVRNSDVAHIRKTNDPAPELTAASAGREEADAKLAERDKAIAELRRQMTQHTRELSRLKAQLGDLQDAAQVTEGEKDRIAQARDTLAQRAQTDQASLQKMQKDLDTLQQERSKDIVHSASLEAKVADLTRLLSDREKTIDQQQALLEHDRDIRELMGARDLYIAEVYDVAKTGETQKSFGRIFLTKGKSLIFYAYDLDQQPGLKKGSTFQAWGQRGPDRTQALNLGIFYQDNASKKRWVVKSEDPKTLEQIDAVFVTLEPDGGSNRPSGKPLLFAHLRIDSNHP
jgi:hypothetical protein